MFVVLYLYISTPYYLLINFVICSVDVKPTFQPEYERLFQFATNVITRHF